MFTKQVVRHINNTLESDLKNKEVQKGKFFEVAQLIHVISEENKLYQELVDDQGEGIPVGIDDTYPFILYHRYLGVSSGELPGRSYGDSRARSASANMLMVVYGNRTRLGLTQEQLGEYIFTQLPVSLEVTNLTGTQKADISPVYMNFNSMEVYQGEGQAIQNLKPDMILFSIQYKIDTIYTKDCINPCSEC